MKVIMHKCDSCAKIHHTEAGYNECMRVHKVLDAFDLMFPPVDPGGCEFTNGGWSVQRDKEWLKKYKAAILKVLGDSFKDYEPWGYSWFRCLDDGRHWIYSRACRVLNICPTCLREWGQGYYSANCKHQDKERVDNESN